MAKGNITVKHTKLYVPVQIIYVLIIYKLTSGGNDLKTVP